MKYKLVAALALWLALFPPASVLPALEKEMTVQVSKTELRSSPAYFGSVVGSLTYADRVRIIERKGSWVKAVSPVSKAAGWLHISALTVKRLAPISGARNAPTSVSYGELSAAEKGFTEQIEKDYREKNRDIDFTWVDKMEKIVVTPEQSAAFLREGKIIPEKGVDQ